MKTILKYIFLFLFGGFLYVGIELLYRSKSHWTMFVAGGIIFVLVGLINEKFPWTMTLWKQCGIATLIITVLEFITGVIVNIYPFQWNVWHYTVLDLFGQISLPFMGLWYLISSVGIILDDIIRWLIFKEEKPHYTIF